MQLDASAIPGELQVILREFLDLTYTKDVGNCTAKGTIAIDGNVIMENVPIPTLLTLEKFLVDLRTNIAALPVLDSTEKWHWNSSEGAWESDEVITHRTKKIQKGIVLYDATPEHPAQTQLVTEDVLAGYWYTTKKSTALEPTKKKRLFTKIEELLKAVKSAREEANATTVEYQELGSKLFTYLLSE